MAATIRIQTGQIAAELAAERLRQEGVPAQVVSDGDLLGHLGTALTFSLIVPRQHERRAREILTELASPDAGEGGRS